MEEVDNGFKPATWNEHVNDGKLVGSSPPRICEAYRWE